MYKLVLKIFEVTQKFTREYKYTLGQDMKRDAMPAQLHYAAPAVTAPVPAQFQ
jgi:hypothetical protein